MLCNRDHNYLNWQAFIALIFSDTKETMLTISKELKGIIPKETP